jgi:magnesium transporter
MVQPSTAQNGAQPRSFCFLSQLLGKKVFGKDHAYLGKVKDVVATFTERYPEIEGLLLQRRQDSLFAPARSKDFIRLAEGKSLDLAEVETRPFTLAERQFLVRDTLWDKQIVDMNGAKVERVNDVQILIYSEKPFLVHVDVGFTGLTRRLGFENGVRSIARAFGRPLKDELVGWKFVQPVPEAALGSVKLNLRQDEMRKLHPGELADIIEELDRDERVALVSSMDPEHAADALEEAEITVQTSVLSELDSALAADILEEMEPAVAADVIEELPAATQESIMAAMEPPERAQLEKLAGAEEGTAAQLMTPDFITCPDTGKARDAWERVRKYADQFETITYVYCQDDKGALTGVVSLRDLILADREAPLTEVMHRRLAAVQRDDDFGAVASEFWKYRFKALPVVDHDGKVEGIITFRHSLDELLPYYSKLAA